jgi:hypothetical protein
LGEKIFPSPLHALNNRLPGIAYLHYNVASKIIFNRKNIVMLSTVSLSEIVLIAAGAIGLYLLILGTVFRKNLADALGWPTRPAAAQTVATSAQAVDSIVSESLAPLIDKPADHPSEIAGVYDPYEDPYYEPIDDGAVTLLKAAEHVVEQIQEVVDHIASHPANPEEVYMKIGAIVSQYSFFEGTEYYDAINSFIAVTVQRDCDLALTEEDLKTLWLERAA